MIAFHEARFPVEIAVRSRGGPERRTDIVLLGSGREERNAKWAHARRRYDAGQGVRSIAALSRVIAFFEERRGRLHGFRFKDRMDFSSAPDGGAPQPFDQTIGAGDGARDSFMLVKTYGSDHAPYVRPIAKPVAGRVSIAVSGTVLAEGVHYSLDATTGVVTFAAGSVPGLGEAVTAGFEFDVPVRFDTDRLDIDLASFEAGEIPSIPLIEIQP